jgi:tripartite-type tricarboxylate transporter receptor subunit TctC
MKTLIFCLILAWGAIASAQIPLPYKEAVIVTSFSAGSGPDSLLRKIQPELSRALGIPVIMENRPGGNGSLAFEACVKNSQNRNQVTLCYTEAAVFWAYPLIYGRPGPTEFLTPLTASHYADLVLVTSPKINSLKDLQQATTTNPNYGSWSIGSVGQISSEQVSRAMNIPAQHIPYKDHNQWLIDVSTERLAFSFATMGSSQALEKQGKLKYLAIATGQRDPDHPTVPTVRELLGNNSNFISLRAVGMFYVDPRMNPQVENTLRTAIRQVLDTPDARADIANRWYKPWTLGEKETTRVLAQEAKHYVRFLKEFGIDLRQ